MKQSKQTVISVGCALLAFVCAMTISIAAQDITHPSTTKTVGEPTHEIQQTGVKNAEVIHVSNHQIVVKLENGRMEFLDLPNENFTVQIDGKDLTVHELTPAMKLSQEIHTVTTPQEVTTLRTVNGKVWQINPPHLMLIFPDNKTKSYTVPDGIVFHVNGADKTVFDLRKGMKIDATVLTVEPQNVIERHHVVTGQSPTTNVAFEGPVLLESSTRDVPSLVASVEPPKPAELPKTASLLPLVGALGLLSLSLFAVLEIIGRRKRSHA
jgi:hypothetical protein